jgi:arginyl-tRNA synthetase
MTQAQTQAIDQLAAQIEGLSLDAVAQAYPAAYPQSNPLDLWRAHIANVLSKISGVSSDIVYRAVSWTTSLDKGDFILAVPALRIKGGSAPDRAAEWAAQVRTSPTPTQT